MRYRCGKLMFVVIFGRDGDYRTGHVQAASLALAAMSSSVYALLTLDNLWVLWVIRAESHATRYEKYCYERMVKGYKFDRRCCIIIDCHGRPISGRYVGIHYCP